MTDALIDPAAWENLKQTAGADFVGELVAAFFEEAPGMLGDMRAACAAGEAEKFRRASHSLKSNSLTFGALKLAAMAKDLEISGLDAVKARGGDPIAAVAAEYEKTAAALKGLLGA